MASPVITKTTQKGLLTEEGLLTATGLIAFNDPDRGDAHTASLAVGSALTVLSDAYGTFTLGEFTDSTATEAGSILWRYTADTDKVDALAKGQVFSNSFTVYVTDASGKRDSIKVAVSLTGANDAVVITSSASPSTTLVEDSGSFVQSDVIAFTDRDVKDVHTVTRAGTAAFGVFTAVKTTDSTGGQGGHVTWTYVADKAKLQALSEGQVAREVFKVGITDGQGSTELVEVTVNLVGANDEVVFTTGVQRGAVAEDNASKHSVSGLVKFIDADLRDTHSATVLNKADGSSQGTYGTLTLANGVDTVAGKGGSQAWTYSVDEAKAQSLAKGQVVTDTLAIQVFDGTNTYSQDVLITVTGANDAVALSSSEASVLVGEVTENAATMGSSTSATGSVAFTDPDTLDKHSAAVQGSGLGKYGTFKVLPGLTESPQEGGGSAGVVVWTYALGSGAEALAEGQRATETFMVTVTDRQGSTLSAPVTLTVMGANDALVVISGTRDITLVENAVNEQSTSGVMTFRDADVLDTHSTYAALAGDPMPDGLARVVAGAYGSFTLKPLVDTANGVAATQGWTYTVDPVAINALAQGERAVEKFTIYATDGHGSVVSQDVTIRLTGTNDAPIVDAAASRLADEVTEVLNPGAVTNAEALRLMVSGQLVATDADHGSRLAYSATNTPAAPALVEFRALGAPAAAALPDDLATALGAGLNALRAGFTLDAAGAWRFSAAGVNLEALRAGDALQLSFGVKVSDAQGAFATSVVLVTVKGTNDRPVIQASSPEFDVLGTVTERSDGASDENTATLSDSGKIVFSDVDLRDAHTVSATAGASGYLGTFTPTLIAGTKTVNWSFSVRDSLLDFLAAGQTLTQTYTVSIQDDSGATANNAVTQVVTVTLVGTNDCPVIESSASGFDVLGTVTERPDGASDENTATLSDSGKIVFSDVDLRDAHTVSATAGASGYLGTFTPTLIAGTKTVNWSFSVRDSLLDFLAAGQTLMQTYTVSIQDNSGATANNTVNQVVTVTLVGTNDRPVIESSASGFDVLGTVTERPDGASDENTATLTDSGKIVFSDVDLRDAHTVSVTAGASGYLGTFTPTLIAGTKTVNWSFSVPDRLLDFLAAGQTLTQTYTVSIQDNSGATANNTVTQVVTVNLVGSADGPSLTVGPVTHQVNPLLASDAVGITNLSFNSANGHLYEYVSTAMTWNQANLAAQAKIRGGVNGYLATITSDAENSFVRSIAASDVWAGGSDAEAEGVWKWVGGPEAGTVFYNTRTGSGPVAGQFTKWSSGEPNNFAGAEESLQINTNGNQWNDNSASRGFGFVIEYSGKLLDTVTEDALLTPSLGDIAVARGSITFNDTLAGAVVTAAAQQLVTNTTHLGTFVLSDLSRIGQTGAVNYTYTVDNVAANDLAQGEQVTEDYVVTFTNNLGSTATTTITVTVVGSNDAPVISVNTASPSDSASVTLAETNVGLSASGTLTVRDGDASDSVDVTLSGVTKSGTTAGLGVNDAILQSYFTLTSPSNLAANAADVHNIAWQFNSGTQAFDYLRAGQSLTLSYGVRAEDVNANAAFNTVANTTQNVAVRIDGSNDVVTLAAPPDPIAVMETVNASGVQMFGAITGTLRATDRDVGDTLTSSVVGEPAVKLDGAVITSGFPIRLVTGSALSLSSGLSNGGEVSLSYRYSPASADLDFLRQGQSLTLTYNVKVSDGRVDSASQPLTFSFTGTNDAPTIVPPRDAIPLYAIQPNGAYGTLMNNLGVWVTPDSVNVAQGAMATVFRNFVVPTNGLYSLQAAFDNIGSVLLDGKLVLSGDSNFAQGAMSSTVMNLTAGVHEFEIRGFNAGSSPNPAGFAVQVLDFTTEQAIWNTRTELMPSGPLAKVMGSVTELADLAVGENDTTLTDQGQFMFRDFDVGDTHTASHTPGQASGYLGTFTSTVNQAAKTVDWTFSVADQDLDTLQEGEILTQTYAVEVKDNSGAANSTATQWVTVLIQGRDDVNHSPVAVDDHIKVMFTARGVPIVVANVLENDHDVDPGDTARLAVQVNPAGHSELLGQFGTAVVTEDGVVMYEFTGDRFDPALSAANFQDSFDYTVKDPYGATDVGTVFVDLSVLNA